MLGRQPDPHPAVLAGRAPTQRGLQPSPAKRLDFADLLDHTPLPFADRVEVNALRAEVEARLKQRP